MTAPATTAICGVLGKRDGRAVRAMAGAMKHRGHARHVVEGGNFTVASSLPLPDPPCLLDGAVRDPDGGKLDAAALLSACSGLRKPEALGARGPFTAAAFVDSAWWLIRDRLGAKPLYYAQSGGGLVFASELKGLLASGLVAKRLNLASVDRYLTLRCVPGPETILQDVYRVPLGSIIRYAGDAVTVHVFDAFDLEERRISRDEAAGRLAQLLEAAVNECQSSRLLWSAGIDCAALGALNPSLEPLFVALKWAWQDEARRARESARLMKRKLTTASASRVTESMLRKAAYHLDEPIADASVLALWMVAEEASVHGNQFVSGHGADEILGGYPRYHFLQKACGAKRLVPSNVMAGLVPALPPNAFVRRGGHYLSAIKDNAETYLSWMSVFEQDERAVLYTDAMQAALHEKDGSASAMRAHFAHRNLTRNMLSLDLSIGLPDLLLAQCDRIMAAHGIGLEFPYLDNALLDFALSLPSKVKYGVRSKPLLRQAMKGRLPGRVRLRARRGFRTPQSGPSFRVIENMAHDTITQERVEAAGLFKWRRVERVRDTWTHNIYRRRQFWALLMFFAWYREFMES
ncbi:MAG: hypothetical protein GWP08_08255 [Nitrospiraceae bacterium]|nr:hypothetical protein [Nitrospiraceae bacterium]